MPVYVMVVDLFGLVLAVVGFTMAFGQTLFRSAPGSRASKDEDLQPGQDPLTYILRIAGVMMMVFGIALSIMMTMFHIL